MKMSQNLAASMISGSGSLSVGALPPPVKTGNNAQKPLEWVTSLLQRFEDQLPIKAGPPSDASRLLMEHSQTCLVNVTKQKSSMVISGLLRMLLSVNSMRTCSEYDLFESQCILLDTLDRCLLEIPPKDFPVRLDEATNVKLTLHEMCRFLHLPSDSNQSLQLKERASKVLYSLSLVNFPAVFSRISIKLKNLGCDPTKTDPVTQGGDTGPDLELLQHIHVDRKILISLIREICIYKPFKKETHASLALNLEKAIWNWMDSYPSEFAGLKQSPCDDLTDASDRLFAQLDSYTSESAKRKASIWPLQMMLLILSPKSLEEIYHASCGGPLSPKVQNKHQYFDTIRRMLSSAASSGSGGASKQANLLTSACISGVKLCRAATYVDVSYFFANIFFNLLQDIVEDLKVLLFNPSKPLLKTLSGVQELDVMIDFFVALFRLKYDNEAFRVCLQHNTAGSPFQLVLVMALYRVAIQPRLPWWPKIDLVYSRSQELRHMFNECLNRITQSASGFVLAGHMPLGMTKSLQRMTVKLKERSSSNAADENPVTKQLLFWLIRLICREPKLFLQERLGHQHADTDIQDMHSSTWELINGLVSLLNYANFIPDIAQEAMEALLCLHQPSNIQLWNPESPLTAMQTFWYIGSQLLFSISQKLLHHQLGNYPEVLRWLRQVLTYRNSYLLSNREIANFGSNEQLCKQAAIKLETVCFLYLWSLDRDAVLTALSLFRTLCDEAEIRCALEDMPQEYHVHAELASATNLQTVGRAVLQKSIYYYLRRIKQPSVSCDQAWEDTHRYWELFTKYLQSYQKSKSDERLQTVEILSRVLIQPIRSSHSQDHELEDIVSIWANMTGFLCSLGGVCFHTQQIHTSPQASIANLLSTDNKEMISGRVACQDQYCPVRRYVSQLLQLLQSDPIEPQVLRHVKELLSHELSPVLYPCLFEQIRFHTDKFFDTAGYVNLNQSNSEFMEHVVYIMKNILSDETGGSAKREKIDERSWLEGICIEPILLSICRYIRFLEETSPHNLTVKTKICHLIEMMMQRRDQLTFRAEIRFRNKLLDHLTDWLMISHPSTGHCTPFTPELHSQIKELDVACVSAVAAILIGLPLQPDQSDVRDVLDAKSQLFQRYFNLFMSLLNDCALPPAPPSQPQSLPAQDDGGNNSLAESETASIRGGMTPEQSVSYVCTSTVHAPLGTVSSSTLIPKRGREQPHAGKLRHSTVQAMTRLLAANIDCGLMHSVGLGYHRDLHVRGAFIEVLTKILQEGMEFDTLNETVMADRYQELVKLVTMITDEGDLPIAMALANVVHVQQLDELARILVTLFDAKHLIYELHWKIFSKEVELAEATTTLFRGNTLASKMMGFCFRIYGSSYLHQLLRPFVLQVMETPDRSYEVEPSRLEVGEDLNENIQNVLNLVQGVFDTIVRSHEKFPHQLRTMCHCLYQVVNSRFPNSGLSAVEMIVFLRFINPAIVSAREHGLMDTAPSMKIKRGLMMVSKILQAIANRATFIKEQCLQSFNIFIQSRMEHARRFTSYITLGVDQPDTPPTHSLSFVSEVQVTSLHRLLWAYQEEVGQYFTAAPAYATLSRRLLTLLAQIGPPPTKPDDAVAQWEKVEMSGQKFEEIMEARNMSERDEYRKILSLNILYQAGNSKSGNPVYYYIARRYKLGEIDDDAFIYYVLVTLNVHQTKVHKPYEIVIDFTHTCSEHRFRTDMLGRLISAMPDTLMENLHACYVCNCNSYARDYANFHQRLLSPFKNSKKVFFLDSLGGLSEYIAVEQQRLPAGTLALDEDVKIFNNALKLSHKDIKCTVKVGPTSLQIVAVDRQKVFGHNVFLNDIYYASEIEEVCLIDDSNVTLTILNEPSPLSLVHNECDRIANAIVQIRTKHELSMPESSSLHSKIRAKDVPGTLLNIALLNLGSTDPSLRSTAYNLLCALAATFDFKLEDELLETEGLLIPANNTAFIQFMSERLALNEPHITLEFLEQCVQNFRQSSNELKHLCLEYMAPWLYNLPKFVKQNDESKREKVVQLVDKLITLTIEEIEMYPLVQSKIWENIGKIAELLDLVMDGFIRRSINGGFGSLQAEILADSTVALASVNMEFITQGIVNRLITVLEKTCTSPQLTLEEHVLWDDIAILARFILMLSFNNNLDVVLHLPYLFHFVTVLVATGPVAFRASIHGIAVNVIHSLCTCTNPSFSEETKRMLRLALTEFSLPKFYELFGINQLTVKTVASAALRLAPHCSLPSQQPSLAMQSESVASLLGAVAASSLLSSPSPKDDDMGLADLQITTEALKEILEACQRELPGRDLVSEWSRVARCFALRYNPALQPRALVVFSWLSKTATDMDVKQMLGLLLQAIKRREDHTLISALLVALTRLHSVLPQNSNIHMIMFWVAVIVFQLEDAQLYEKAAALMEKNLQTLDAHGAFEFDSLEKLMMEIRRPLEWEFKALDQQVGLSFRHNFNFALVGYLLKGLRHPQPTAVSLTVRLLNLLLYIVAKPTKRNRYEVTGESLPYLLGLLPFAEEVRRRCHLHMATVNSLSISDSSETLTIVQRASLTAIGSSYLSHSSDSTTLTACAFDNPDDLLEPSSAVILPGLAMEPKKRPQLTLDTVPPAPKLGVQMPKYTDFRHRSWREKQAYSIDYASQGSLRKEEQAAKVKLVSKRHQLARRSHSLPLSSENGEDNTESDNASCNVETQTSPKEVIVENVPLRLKKNAPKISISDETGDAGLDVSVAVVAERYHRTNQRKSAGSSRADRASTSETNVLLDPDLLARQDMQALVVTVLATLIRNTTDEYRTRILFEYLAEASDLFPKVFPVIHSLLDNRITQALQLCHDPGLLRAVLHIIQNMVPATGGDQLSSEIFTGTDESQRQHISFLQAYGFGGLWRFAGPFLSKSASQSAMTAEVCSCLERLVGTLGELPPLTPPSRLPSSPVFAEFPFPMPSPRESHHSINP